MILPPPSLEVSFQVFRISVFGGTCVAGNLDRSRASAAIPRPPGPGPTRHPRPRDLPPLGPFRPRHYNPHARANRGTPGHSRALRIPRNSVFAVLQRVRQPNTSRDSVRVRFGKCSDKIFGNRLIVFGFRYVSAQLRRAALGSRFRV